MKKIILVVIGFVILVIGSIYYSSYQNYKNGVSSTTEYYQNLKKECEQKNSKNCCLASVKRMEETNSYRVSRDGVCDYGYKKEMMKCIDSFAWCEKQSINDTSKFAFYQKLKNRCKITGSNNPDQLSCCLDSVKTMEIVGSTMLLPRGDYKKPSKEFKCPKGLEKMTLRCSGAYTWCQTSNNPEGEDFVPVPIDASTIKPINESNSTISNFKKSERIEASATSHQKQPQTKKEKVSSTAKLLFKSGFEDGVYIDKKKHEGSEDYLFIKGKDNKSGYAWPINILGASGSGLHCVADDDRKAINTELQKVIGHDGTMTVALFQKENYEQTGDTQYPYEILDIKDGKKDLYVKFWMKLDSASLHQPDKWRAIFEYKTKDYDMGNDEGLGYRLIAFIYTDQNGKPYWHIQGDKDPENTIWEVDNFDIPIPENKWFLTEFYWKWSDGQDGKTIWKINHKTVAEHTGPTTRNSKPIDFIMLTQIYGDANPKHQWIDDIEIWDAVPE